jgi:beta-xylosidase
VVATDHGFLMYYSVRETSAGRQCLSVAASATPGGPFTDTSVAPLTCQTGVGGSIDPAPFTAPDGTHYLLWKSDDNALGRASRIGIQELSADGMTLVGPRPRLLTATAWWQQGVVEGPAMVAVSGRFYLFYGANHRDTVAAGIGYAVCDTPTGPCTNQSGLGPWLRSAPAALGPSGPDIFTGPDGRAWLAYHAWSGRGASSPARQLWITPLSFVDGSPVIG